MGTRRLVAWLPLVAAVVATTVVSAGPAPHASADIYRPLRGEFYDLAVDETNGRVFLSRGPRGRGLVVADLRGRIETTITGLRGTTAMEFSANRSRLYVGLFDEHAIAIVDPATLSVVKRPLPPAAGKPAACPRDLAVLDGAIWFVDHCDPGESDVGMLRSYTPATRRTTSHDVLNVPRLTTDPASNSLLVASNDMVSIHAFDVARSPARTLTTRAALEHSYDPAVPQTCSTHLYLGTLTLIPGTDEFLTAGGYIHSRDDLSYRRHTGCLLWDPFVNDTAARADGLVAFSFSSPSNVYAGTPDVLTMRPGGSFPGRRYYFRRQLEWSTDAAIEWGVTNLYQLSWTHSRRDKGGHLRIVTPHPAAGLTTWTRHRRYDAGDRVRLNIKLRGASGPRTVLIRHGDLSGNPYRARVRLDRFGKGTYRFRIHPDAYEYYLLDARTYETGEVIHANRLQLGVRR